MTFSWALVMLPAPEGDDKGAWGKEVGFVVSAGPGGRLDAFQIDEGVKALYATGLFQDIRPSIQGGRLILVVIENPVINRIAFEGNKKVKDEQLRAEIQSKKRGTC